MIKQRASVGLLAAGLVGCLALAACGADTKAQPSPEKSVTHLLVLGDSYSSGVGAGSPEPDDPGCGRSLRNYGQLYARAARAKGTEVSVRTAACGGATTEDLFASQKAGIPPQIDAVTKSDDLVFLTLTGNDLSLIEIVTRCLTPDAVDAAACNGALTAAQSAVGDGTDASGELAQRLLKALRAIGERAPHAKIVLIGYPQLEGDDAWTVTTNGFTVQAGARVRTLLQTVQTLEQSVVAAANSASGSRRYQFVGTLDAFNGPPFHGLYAARSNPDRWLISHDDDNEEAFHPNPTGWAEIARILEREVPAPQPGKHT